MAATNVSDSGLFLVLDGTEGSGKSTQARRLADRLEAEGSPPVLTRDPGTTGVGEKVRAILLDPAMGDMAMRCEMLLYMAARAQMMSQIILPALSAGKIVICDRFVSSTLAYQLSGDGLTAAEIRQVGEVAIRGRWPDLTVLLDMPADKSLARVKGPKDRIEQRSLAYHQQVREKYLQQAKEDPQRFRVVSADRPIDAVAADVWSAVGETVAKWKGRK
ncbi:MAG TPA: dTMP kinase [Tepidisphaeraceae bacterium]|jgi:dTMP kinase|nr:dTMP kinase [Tepidisphaeraceae bacterium]